MSQFMCAYEHTQRGWIHYLLYPVTGAFAVAWWCAWSSSRPGPEAVVLPFAALVTLVICAAFHHLTVRDEGDHLALRFGPLPLFSKRIPYADITAVEPDRTKWIDGWGIHYVAFRGWTWNISGFDCVKVCCGKKVLRIGTDDRENLSRFLRAKLAGC